MFFSRKNCPLIHVRLRTPFQQIVNIVKIIAFSPLHAFIYLLTNYWLLLPTPPLKNRSEVKVAQSCPTLWPHVLHNPWNSPGQDAEVPFPSPGDLPNPGIEPRSPTLQADSLPAEPQGKPSKPETRAKMFWEQYCSYSTLLALIAPLCLRVRLKKHRWLIQCRGFS